MPWAKSSPPNWLPPLPWLPYAPTIGKVIAVALITYVTLIFGELVPKRWALSRSEAVASVVAVPMSWLAKIAAPFVVAGALHAPGAADARPGQGPVGFDLGRRNPPAGGRKPRARPDRPARTRHDEPGDAPGRPHRRQPDDPAQPHRLARHDRHAGAQPGADARARVLALPGVPAAAATRTSPAWSR